jgi:hypothetical protein
MPSLPGEIVITNLVTADAGSTDCGGALASVTFDFYPSDGSAPIRGQTGLEYAGVPLTRRCVELVGMHVGGTYTNVSRESYGERCHFEHYTNSPVTYSQCYEARCSTYQDAGADVSNDAPPPTD